MNETRMTAKNFTPDLTRGETIAGWIYLPVHMFLLPVLLGMLQMLYPSGEISDVTVNLIYYGIGILVTAVCFLKLLRREFDHLCDRVFYCISSFCAAYCAWYLAMLVLSLILEQLSISTETPNDATIQLMAADNFRMMKAIGIFLAPIVEEVVFRGVVFQSLRKKSRLLAYGVSVGLFCLYHVWQYAVAYQDPVVLLYALEYIPITLAITWSYERSGSLWTAIAFHAANNLMNFMVIEAIM